MPKRGLTRKRAAADNAQELIVSSAATKQRELLRVIEERPDKPVLIRTRRKLLLKLEKDLDRLYASFIDVAEGRAATQSSEMLEAIIRQLEALPLDADLQVRRNLSLAVLNLSDASKMQQSRQQMLTVLFNKLLIDTKETTSIHEGEALNGGMNGMFKGATVNFDFGAGKVKRGIAAKQAEAIDVEAEAVNG